MNDGLAIDKIVFDAASRRKKIDEQQKEVPNKNNNTSKSTTKGHDMTMQSLYSNSLFREAPKVDPPFQRYKRRNSAIASMLFQSVSSAAVAAADSSPRSAADLPSLRLSTALHPMDPAEALNKAKQLLTNPSSVNTSSPSSQKSLSAMKKRASAPWSHKYYMEPSSSDPDSQPRKRQRTSFE